MFESFEVQHGERGGLSSLNPLLIRYRRNLKYQEILGSDRILKEFKSKLRTKSNKAHLLRYLEQCLRDRPKPEETYEVWDQYPNLVTYGSKNYDITTKEYNEEILERIITAEEDEEEEDGEDEEDDPLDTLLHDYLGDNNHHRSRGHYDFVAMINGNEVADSTGVTKDRVYLNNLMFFLHTSVLKKRWQLAYKLICTIIKNPYFFDIRYIWPIVVEVLHKTSRKHKERQFFSWLVSNHILGPIRPTVRTAAPAFRTGSKFKTPMYLAESFWSLLRSGEYKKVQSDLEPLTMNPPYNADPTLWYIHAMSYLMENDELVKNYKKEDDDDYKMRIVQRMERNFEKMDKCLAQCSELHFQFPQGFIEDQKRFLWAELNDENDQFVDAREDNESPASQRVEEFIDALEDNESQATQRVADSAQPALTHIFSESDESSSSEEEFDDAIKAHRQGDGKDRLPQNSTDGKTPDEEEKEVPDPYEDEEIPDPYDDDEEEIPDPYDEEEIPDPYDEDEIPDPYDEEEIPDAYD